MSTKRKAPGKLAPPTVKSSAKRPTKTVIDESRTSVAGTDALADSQMETIEISSDAASEDGFTDEEEAAMEAEDVNGESKPQINGKHAADQDESDDEATAPSFGELLRNNDAIDVPALLQQVSAAGHALSQPARAAIVPPSHQSLTTVLTQALRTDDVDLLESCLHTTDLPTIRNTIENIDSTLAGNLLNKLAARLYRRPGRAGSLMTWIQWTLVAHGGALASQPKVIQGLSGLQKVLSERAKGLNSLLALKGKLDMLEGQMDMRRRMQRSSGLAHHGDEEEEEEEDVVWVEGETGDSSDLVNGRRRRAADEDEDDDVPVMNGVVGESSDEDDDMEEEDDESEGEDESLDEDEVDHEDVDESMGEDEESDVDAAPPSKVQKVSRSFPKRK